MNANETLNTCGSVEEKKCGSTVIKQYYGCGCCNNVTDIAGGSENGDGYSPYIGENGNWFEWSTGINDFVDTGVHAEGPRGHSGISSLSPHNWTVGSEVDLGDGSYGYRWKGNITGSANTESSVLLSGFTMGLKILSYGGWWDNGVTIGNPGYPVNTAITISSPSVYSLFHLQAAGESINFKSKTNVARTNAPYDIWIRYTKA